MRGNSTVRRVRTFLVSLTAVAVILGASACGGATPGSNEAIDKSNKLYGCGMFSDAPCDRLGQLLGRTGPGKWDEGIVTNLVGEGGKDAVARVDQNSYTCDARFLLAADADAAVLIEVVDSDEYGKGRVLLPKGPSISAADLPGAWREPNLSKPAFLKLVKAGLVDIKDGKPTKLAVGLGKICQKVKPTTIKDLIPEPIRP